MRDYDITEEEKRRFAGIYMLEYMINTPATIPVYLDDDDVFLDPVLTWLMEKRYIDIKNDQIYIPTLKGREFLKNFLEKYYEYLKAFDVFCAVDLTRGEFAFSSYTRMKSEKQWKKFLNEKRWEDLRIAVAEYKKMNPLEVVFMHFISEGRFGRDANGWQFDLILGSVWNSILEICNTALHVENLAYDDDMGHVSGEAVITDVIVQGAEVMLEVLEARPIADREASGFSAESPGEQYVEKVQIKNKSKNYYKKYLDPNFISQEWKNRYN